MKKNVVIFLFFAMCFCLLAPGLHAQEDLSVHKAVSKKLNAEVLAAYRAGRYQTGIPLAEKAYQYALQHLARISHFEAI